MMNEDIIKAGSTKTTLDFGKSTFEMPSPEQETILQQAILSGLLENFSRRAPVFDSQGNEILTKNKAQIFYESQECEHKLKIQSFSGLSGKN